MMMFSYIIFLRLNRNKQGRNLAKWLKISKLFSSFSSQGLSCSLASLQMTLFSTRPYGEYTTAVGSS